MRDFDAVVKRARAEILEDIASGRVPATVRTFAQLHDYVDANGYGGAFENFEEGQAGDEGHCNFWNHVQNSLHDWLAAGRPE